MNRTFRIIFIVLVGGLFSSIPFIQADYNTIVGTTNTYEVNISFWDLQKGSQTSIGTGINFEDIHFPEGTTFTIEVTDTSSTEVDWNMTVGTSTDLGSSSGFDLIGIAIMMVYPAFTITMYTWNQTELDLGLGIIRLFFVDVEQVNEFFIELTDPGYIEEEFDDNLLWTYDKIAAHLNQSTGITEFDWVMNGRYYNATENSDYSGEHYYKLAYDSTTGEVMGYHWAMNYTGTVIGEYQKFCMEQEIEMVGYDLPAFYFNGSESPFTPPPTTTPPSTPPTTALIELKTVTVIAISISTISLAVFIKAKREKK
ncbi:MAG: hypothetical protein FK734_00640 [Asgard group archaeon]|nr:hypothetical protein [Asgard group archaeon]